MMRKRRMKERRNELGGEGERREEMGRVGRGGGGREEEEVERRKEAGQGMRPGLA